MMQRSAARRYARALLDVAVKEGTDPRAIERDLGAFADLVAAHPPLQQALFNPAVPTPRKRAAVGDLVARAEGLSPIVSKLLLLLAERDRLRMLPDLVEAYRERLLEHLNIVRAEVVTSVPLSNERVLALESRLAASTGKEVTVETRVDPGIIGGVVTRIGSIVYDGSVARQLERLKDRLVEGT
jgi:F-type H+-transporting ATPase subunit delta